MAVRLLALLCAAMSAAACGLVVKNPSEAFGRSPLPAGDMVSRAEALEDLSALMRLLENAHADPYRFHPRAVVDGERQRLAETMPASLTRRELCLRFSRLVATLDDGHTSMGCDTMLLREWRKAANASTPQSQAVRMFPPHMRLDDRGHLIVAWPNDAPGVLQGDRLVRLDGQDADALLVEWAREVSHDTDAGRRAAVARQFRVHMALHGIDAPYQVTVASGETPGRDVTIRGEPVNYLWQERPKPAPPASTDQAAAIKPTATTAAAARSAPPANPDVLSTPFFRYRIIQPGVAYMDFFTIFDGLDTVSHFEKAVNTMFTRVASDQPRVLIIDVRENGGGEDSAANALLRHITEKPFRLLASLQVKRSDEARDFINSMIQVPFRWIGLPLLSSELRGYYLGPVGSLSAPLEREVRAHKRAEPFFAGPVCVLTGPHTYSAAVDFAEAVKTYGLATIVGEETGGQPNQFGNDFPFPLPRSGLSVDIATARSLRANGDAADFRVVTPDIVVRPTASDIRIGADPVFERAKSCPERSVKAARSGEKL